MGRSQSIGPLMRVRPAAGSLFVAASCVGALWLNGAIRAAAGPSGFSLGVAAGLEVT